jgi:hypothetical protein
LYGEPLEALAEQLADKRQSLLVLSPAQQRERSEELISAAAGKILTSALCERLAVRLEETAVFLQAEGDGDGVAALLALAERLRGSTAPLAIPYLRSCLDASLERAREQRAQEQSGQLIVPG